MIEPTPVIDIQIARRQREDLPGLKNPNCWPHRPLLPVKRYIKTEGGREDSELGFILAGIWTVFLGNIFDLSSLPGITYGEKVEHLPSLVYKSLEEFQADGWVVD